MPSNDRSITQPPTPGISGKLRSELSERTAELSRLREQMAEQQRELESLRNRSKSHDLVQGDLQETLKELVCVLNCCNRGA